MTGIGRQEYSGLDPDNEDVVRENVPAHIQVDRQGSRPDARLPGDAAGQAIWRIIFKADKGLARTHDVIEDEMGHRYQVIAADWGPLVTTCRCQVLES